LWQCLFGVCGEHLAYAWCHYELKAHFHPSLLITLMGIASTLWFAVTRSKYV